MMRVNFSPKFGDFEYRFCAWVTVSFRLPGDRSFTDHHHHIIESTAITQPRIRHPCPKEPKKRDAKEQNEQARKQKLIDQHKTERTL
jgi:hypothetical protein